MDNNEPMQVEKIHDVRKHLGTDDAGLTQPHGRAKIGVIHLKAIRVLAFIAISVALIMTAVLCVLAVWEYVSPDYAWRSLASLGIISAAVAAFVALNEGFGPVIRG